MQEITEVFRELGWIDFEKWLTDERERTANKEHEQIGVAELKVS